MLAPRKTLWSTPAEVAQAAIQALQITAEDVVFDVGAGDGRFIVACGKATGARCIGVEIDEERSNEAKAAIEANGLSDTCSIQTCNALDVDYSSATVIFMYLIPRGLKIMQRVLEGLPQPIRVATYMSPLPGLTPATVLKCSTEAHPEARWPLFIYRLPGRSCDSYCSSSAATEHKQSADNTGS